MGEVGKSESIVRWTNNALLVLVFSQDLSIRKTSPDLPFKIRDTL